MSKLYEYYTETLKLTKKLKQFDEIRSLIYPLKILKDFKFFTISKEKNKEIELYIQKN